MSDRPSSSAALLEPDLATLRTALTTYPGGKNGAGIWQRLISLMPPHEVYVEAFLGSGAILRRKRPARSNVGIDVDAGVIARHLEGGRSDVSYWTGDAREWLRRFAEDAQTWPGKTLIYLDPPYLGSSRLWERRDCYRHEMKGEADHEELLQLATSVRAMVMISGYPSPIYERALSGWQRVEYLAQTRGGPKPEVAWMNYPEPTELHDYRFLGRDYHERCRVRRKIGRWQRRLAAMPVLERAAVLAALGDAAGGRGA